MKFHCDRCKTRYSIADDRVRGKILKIRCKNCSTVITIKEGAQPAAPRQGRPASEGARRTRASSRSGARRRPGTSSGSALQGAFEEELRRPQSVVAADVADAPAVLDAEWYVSQDGEQFGPFTLPRAQGWVGERPADEELFCWSEGFDDWLPVEKVSHFRGLRGQPGSGLMSMPPGMQESEESLLHSSSGLLPAREETPVPLFAATLAQVVADAPNEDSRQAPMFPRRNGSSASQAGRAPSAAGSPPGGGSLFGSAMAAASGAPGNPHGKPGETVQDPSHDFEIGEASRVVKLPMLARGASHPAPAPLGPPGLPGVGRPGPADNNGALGRGTGSEGQMGGRALSGLPVIHGGGTVDMPRPEVLQPRRVRSGMMMPIAIGSSIVVGVVSVLLFVALAGEDDDSLVRRGEVGGKGEMAYTFDKANGDRKQDKGNDQSAPKGGGRRVVRKPSGGGKSSSLTTGTATQGPVAVDPDEVDLSGGPAGELDPDDLFDVYNANKIGVTMCYNSALKRDPLLSVRRADVNISVAPSGSVSSVSIPSLNGTPLGQCLEKRIRSWRFPRASRVFSSRFPIIFQT
ncbi:MAG TPA: AgmX/PglI C-terminal domain-containing protein [Kofleriaceae bacterium]|nr:AgmX/PglI C-terminal domain-containing protein [Kofleriaceae bacterium]